jgi:hypothetical protein
MEGAGKIKGKGEGEKRWGGGSRKSLPQLCYAISALLYFYGLTALKTK